MMTIEATGVEKYFGKKAALKGLDLKVRQGDIHAILGPNGSGKTTLVKILSTLLKADSGIIKVAGYDIEKDADKVREKIRLTEQSASIDDELTGFENLYLIARLLGFPGSKARQRANELLSAFDLKDSANRLVKTYSGGMRRKLDIAGTLVSVSEILFLDEPTTGLDPRSRIGLWSIIKSLAKKGTTILLTTQYLEEAEQLADKISVLDEGKMIIEGTSDELKAAVGNNILRVHLNEQTYADQKLNGLLTNFSDSVPIMDSEGDKISFAVSGQKQAIEILGRMQSNDIEISGFNLSRPDLNEVFLALTGKATAEDDNRDSNGNGQPTPSVDMLINHAKPYVRSGIMSNKFMFGWRNIMKIKHIPEQFFDVLITPVMFTFMFTYIFGGAIAGSTTAYVQFLIPGILMQTLTFNTMYAGINISNDIRKGIFDRFRSMPIWLPAPLSGIFIGDFFRHLISGLLVLLLGFFLGFRSDAGLPAFIIAFVLMISFAMSISWIFIIMGLTMRSTSAVMSVGWLFLMPLVFLSNIFVDPSTMPGWLTVFISYNPLAWQVDAVRELFAGTTSVGNILSAFGISVAISAVLFPVAVYFYKKERT